MTRSKIDYVITINRYGAEGARQERIATPRLAEAQAHLRRLLAEAEQRDDTALTPERVGQLSLTIRYLTKDTLCQVTDVTLLSLRDGCGLTCSVSAVDRKTGLGVYASSPAYAAECLREVIAQTLDYVDRVVIMLEVVRRPRDHSNNIRWHYQAYLPIISDSELTIGTVTPELAQLFGHRPDKSGCYVTTESPDTLMYQLVQPLGFTPEQLTVNAVDNAGYQLMLEW